MYTAKQPFNSYLENNAERRSTMEQVEQLAETLNNCEQVSSALAADNILANRAAFWWKGKDHARAHSLANNSNIIGDLTVVITTWFSERKDIVEALDKLIPLNEEAEQQLQDAYVNLYSTFREGLSDRREICSGGVWQKVEKRVAA